MTDQERQKAEELISRLELSVGQMFPRDSGNAALLATMIQTLNGLRSLLGLVQTALNSEGPCSCRSMAFELGTREFRSDDERSRRRTSTSPTELRTPPAPAHGPTA